MTICRALYSDKIILCIDALLPMSCAKQSYIKWLHNDLGDPGGSPGLGALLFSRTGGLHRRLLLCAAMLPKALLQIIQHALAL